MLETPVKPEEQVVTQLVLSRKKVEAQEMQAVEVVQARHGLTQL